MAWSDVERAAMVSTLEQTDGDAPTLCEGWDVRHLLAHLVLREHAPWRIAADALRRPSPGQEKNLGEVARSAQTAQGYAALVQRFAAGPPKLSPMGWAGDAGNLIEYVVHHEDIRRGGGGAADPRVLPAEQEEQLWRRLPLMARMGYRGAPGSVTLVDPLGRRALVRKGSTGVEVAGGTVELVLHALGRRTAADVTVLGDADAVKAFDSWALR